MNEVGVTPCLSASIVTVPSSIFGLATAVGALELDVFLCFFWGDIEMVPQLD